MIRLTQPQTLVHPARASAPGVPPDGQPAGTVFSALYDASADAQGGRSEAWPKAATNVDGAGRIMPAPDAVTRQATVRHTFHRHPRYLAIPVDLALADTAQLPAVQKTGDSEDPDVTPAQIDEPTALAVTTPFPPTPAAALIASLETAKPAPRPDEVPFASSAAENSRPKTVLIPAEAAAPPDALAAFGTPPNLLLLPDPTLLQNDPNDPPGAISAEKVAATADLRHESPSHPAESSQSKTARPSPEARQTDIPALPSRHTPSSAPDPSQNLPAIPIIHSAISANPAFATTAAPGQSARATVADLPPETALPEPASPTLDARTLPQMRGSESLLTIPAALRSHLAWRTAGVATPGASQALPNATALLAPALQATVPQPAKRWSASLQSAPQAERVAYGIANPNALPTQPPFAAPTAEPTRPPQVQADDRSVGPAPNDPADGSSPAIDRNPAPPIVMPPQTQPPVYGLTAPDTAASLPPPVVALHAALPKALSGAIAHAASKLDDPDRVELTLDPVELGRVRFAVVSTGDQLQVSLTVERLETLDLLRRCAGELRAELREQGFANPTLSFGQWGQDKSANPPQPAAEFIETLPPTAPEPITPIRIPAAGLDLRL